jgi:hypothetical protein
MGLKSSSASKTPATGSLLCSSSIVLTLLVTLRATPGSEALRRVRVRSEPPLRPPADLLTDPSEPDSSPTSEAWKSPPIPADTPRSQCHSHPSKEADLLLPCYSPLSKIYTGLPLRPASARCGPECSGDISPPHSDSHHLLNKKPTPCVEPVFCSWSVFAYTTRAGSTFIVRMSAKSAQTVYAICIKKSVHPTPTVRQAAHGARVENFKNLV